MRAQVRFFRAPYAGRLLGGTLVGRLPTGMSGLAIMLFVREHGGSYTLGGVLSAAYVVAMAVGQPVLGRVMDRTGQTWVLSGAAVASAAGFAVPVAVGLDPLAVTVVAVVVAGFATPPLEAGLRALWAYVLDDAEQVRVAFGLDAASQELIFVCGPLLVVAATAVSVDAALILTGLIGLAGTLVVVTASPSRSWRGAARDGGDWAGPLRSTGLRTVLGALVLVGFALGTLSVAAVTYGDALHAGSAAGLVLAANAGGAFCGGVAHATLGHAASARATLPRFIAGLAVCYLPLAAVPSLPYMLVLAFVAGIFLAPTLATAFTLVDGLAPRGTVTEAFAWVVTAMAGGSALGAATAGRAADLGGARASFACAALGGVLSLAVVLTAHRTLRPAPAVPAT